jgi:hypothetical protein
MARDPRIYTAPPSQRVPACRRGLRAAADVAHDQAYPSTANNRNSVAGALGKVGDLGVWSKIGGTPSKIAVGMRALAALSNVVRSGRGSMPSGIASSTDWVFQQLGLHSPALQVFKDLNPSVFNAALGQAQNIYDMVSHGKFSVQSIPYVIAEFIEMEQLVRGIFSEPKKASGSYLDPCGASPYAMDLIAYAPKYQFLFVVEFKFAAEYTALNSNNIAFVVKSSSRPKVDFEYDDVNYYNFHSKAIKRTMYQPMNMHFYDDDQNNAMRFYTSYLKLMSPIANMNFNHAVSQLNFFDASAMEYGAMDRGTIDQGLKGSPYSASVGALKNPSGVIIQQINLYHVYRQGRLMNVYKFFNPRLTSLELDDLSMEGDVNEFSMQFSYDGMFIVPGYDLYDALSSGSGGDYPINQLTQRGLYTNGLQWVGNSSDRTTDNGSNLSGKSIDTAPSDSGAKIFSDPHFTGGQGFIDKKPTPETINETPEVKDVTALFDPDAVSATTLIPGELSDDEIYSREYGVGAPKFDGMSDEELAVQVRKLNQQYAEQKDSLAGSILGAGSVGADYIAATRVSDKRLADRNKSVVSKIFGL